MMVERFDGVVCSRGYLNFREFRFMFDDGFCVWLHNVGCERFFDFCFVVSGFPFSDSFFVVYRFVL